MGLKRNLLVMKWIDALMQGHITINGQHHDLSHLLRKNFTLELEATSGFPASEIIVSVDFTSHCVSYGERKDGSPLDFSTPDLKQMLLYDHRHKPRCFCPIRYRQSHSLPAIVDRLPSAKCFFGAYENWFVVNDLDDAGQRVEYVVFFSVQRDKNVKNGLLITIESAYAPDGGAAAIGYPKDRRKEMKFKVLAAKRVRGEQVRRPR